METPDNRAPQHTSGRRSTSKSSLSQEEIPTNQTSTSGAKRKKNSPGNTMSKNKKQNNRDMNPTNAQLMSTLDRLAEKMDELPNKNNLRNVEAELTNKMHQNAMKFDKHIQDNSREIKTVSPKLDKHIKNIARLEEDLEKQKNNPVSFAEHKRNEAKQDRYLKARRSFRIWPLDVRSGEIPVNCARRFFILNMKVPAELAKDVEIECVKKAVQSHPRSRIHDEYVVIFADTESRDAVKAYANGLASCQGEAGLRLDLTDSLKGSYRILEEHGLSVKNLYGQQTKRNIKFDDRTNDLMMDIKLPDSLKWHNVTIEQAKQAKKIREEMEIKKLCNGQTIAGASHDRERAKVLMLAYSPDKATGSNTIATGANLIDIEDAFTAHGASQCNGSDQGKEHCGEENGGEEDNGDDSDKSMSRLLHGQKARNPYR